MNKVITLNLIFYSFFIFANNTEKDISFYSPNPNWTYFIKADRKLSWNKCKFCFLSLPNNCQGRPGPDPDLWLGAGKNQKWKLVPVLNKKDVFYIKADMPNCQSFLSYDGEESCDSQKVNVWPESGKNQEFVFIPVPNTLGTYKIKAVGREKCPNKFLSFPKSCDMKTGLKLSLKSTHDKNLNFVLFPQKTKRPIKVNSIANGPCADPHVWYEPFLNKYHLVCTGGNLPLYESSDLSYKSKFVPIGNALDNKSNNHKKWLNSDERWAPENFLISNSKAKGNLLFFSVAQSSGPHRIGWAYAHKTRDKAYKHFSSKTLLLSDSSGGEIDPNIFSDPKTGKTYILWKSDDNRVQSKKTRIWIQEIEIKFKTKFVLPFRTSFENINYNHNKYEGWVESLITIGSPKVILDSSGLWWVDSWVKGGSLIEAPEMIFHDEWYYLFFASGRFCQSSYAEGVARSRSIFGPYEKLSVPLLSTNMRFMENKNVLIGPGHASFIKDKDKWFVVWHASVKGKCDRYPYISELFFDSKSGGWPQVKLH